MTREGSPILIYVGAEITELAPADLPVQVDDLHRPTGFVIGRKLDIKLFEPLRSNEKHLLFGGSFGDEAFQKVAIVDQLRSDHENLSHATIGRQILVFRVIRKGLW